MAVTIRDIAKHCGVGVGTVSRAINNSGYVKQETKEAILRYAEEQGWQASKMAASLKTGKTKTVALLANTIMFPNNAEVVEKVIKKIRPEGYHSFVSVGRSFEYAKEELTSYIERKIDAVVIIVPYMEISEEVKKLHQAGIRVIALWSGTGSPDCINITTDHTVLGYRAMRQLVDAGHSRIAYFGQLGKSKVVNSIDDWPIAANTRRQVDGVLKAGEEAGLNQDLNRDFVSDSFSDFTDFEKLLTSRQHTAFICSTRRLLTEFYSCCIKHKISIPDDLSVICLGRDEAFKGYNPPPDHFRHDMDKITDLAVERITNKTFKTGDELLTSPIFIPGQSIKHID